MSDIKNNVEAENLEQEIDEIINNETQADIGESSEDETATLEQELANALSENAALKDAALRAMAEAENIRRRTEKEKADARAYALDKFARELLPIADNLLRALAHVTDAQRQDAGFNSFVEGIELTEKELLAAFERNNIVKVGIQGEKFDPNIHQAVAQIPSAIAKDHIAEVFQPGFTLSGRVLRAAMVAVSAGD